MDSLNDLIWTDEDLPNDEGDASCDQINNPYICMDVLSCDNASEGFCYKILVSGSAYCSTAG